MSKTKKEKTTENKKRKGLSVQALIHAFCIATIILSSLIGLLTFQIPWLVDKFESDSDNIRGGGRETIELLNIRAKLTEQARYFLETPDKMYVESYFLRLKSPNNVKSLVEKLKTYTGGAYGEKELDNIHEISDSLINYEIYAMQLTASAYNIDISYVDELISEYQLNEQDMQLDMRHKLEKAQSYLFGKNYQRLYTTFEESTTDFQHLLFDELNSILAQTTKKLDAAVVCQRVSIILFTTIVFVVICVLLAGFVRPTTIYANKIRANKPLPPSKIRELSNLVASYNTLYEYTKKQKEDWVAQAENDALTGLSNGRAFAQLKMQLLGKDRKIAVVLIDLDGFKQINDLHGHHAGDMALKRFAEELRKVASPEDHLIRLGGDEFLVIINNVEEKDFATIKANYEKLKNSLATPTQEVKGFTISAGITFSDHGYYEELLQQADRAMYTVKNAGGGGIHIYSEKDDNTLIDIKASKQPRKKILLIDDFKANRVELTRILAQKYIVIQASTAERTIQLIEERGKTYDCFILDISMPGDEGMTILEYIKQHGWLSKIPVIAISTDQNTMLKTAYKMGCTSYLSPPFIPEVALKTVSDAISLSMTKREMGGVILDEVKDFYNKYDSVFVFMVRLMEFHSFEPSWRIRQVEIVTKLLSDKLKSFGVPYTLSSEDVWRFQKASILHDIGKYSIPEEILSKPGSLTPEEFAIAKTHVTEGAKIIDKMGDVTKDVFLATAHEICLYHHERYDGSGYPYGLVGDQIPIAAQIVGIADCYDALVSERPYAPKYTHRQAIDMIVNGECGTFNPLLIKCLETIDADLEAKLSEAINAYENSNIKDFDKFLEQVEEDDRELLNGDQSTDIDGENLDGENLDSENALDSENMGEKIDGDTNITSSDDTPNN